MTTEKAPAEVLIWHDANAVKPDAMTTVLTWRADDGYPFENGHFDGDGWIADATGGPLTRVTHWALPEGPKL